AHGAACGCAEDRRPSGAERWRRLGRRGRACRPASRRRGGKCDLRRNRPAHSHAADNGYRSQFIDIAPPADKSVEALTRRLIGVTIVSRVSISVLILLCAAGTSRAADPVSPPLSPGEYLARAADCVACHSIPGGKAFAGGLKMGTPLGAIYSTNITPDSETGIGSYSLADFERAVRQGTTKDGRHLYPAMPYPSYSKLSDADVAALYRFFMKQVPPVHRANLKSEIPALLSFRWPVAIWNYFFAPSGSYVAKPAHDAVWNRGAYLV